jgi:aerobic carbon-monoxide dehydrogenase small subunit
LNISQRRELQEAFELLEHYSEGENLCRGQGNGRSLNTKRVIKLIVNGRTYERLVEVRLTLADFLRGELDLTGTHLGCEHGVCGACTILFEGAPVRSCLMLAVQADGSSLQTVESLANDNDLHPLQRAFQDQHALQCGFCTPGFLMTAVAFLKDHPAPTRQEVREAINGNICRCTGYQPIVEAILQAAAECRGDLEKRLT